MNNFPHIVVVSTFGFGKKWAFGGWGFGEILVFAEDLCTGLLCDFRGRKKIANKKERLVLVNDPSGRNGFCATASNGAQPVRLSARVEAANARFQSNERVLLHHGKKHNNVKIVRY